MNKRDEPSVIVEEVDSSMDISLRESKSDSEDSFTIVKFSK